MKIIFYDNTSVFVSHEQGQKIKAAVASGIEWIDVNDTMYAVKSIKQIHPETMLEPNQKALPENTKEISEEQRLKNIERIRQMKRDFMAKLETRRST